MGAVLGWGCWHCVGAVQEAAGFPVCAWLGSQQLGRLHGLCMWVGWEVMASCCAKGGSGWISGRNSTQKEEALEHAAQEGGGVCPTQSLDSALWVRMPHWLVQVVLFSLLLCFHRNFTYSSFLSNSCTRIWNLPVLAVCQKLKNRIAQEGIWSY